jgi:hypothetical protein
MRAVANLSDPQPGVVVGLIDPVCRSSYHSMPRHRGEGMTSSRVAGLPNPLTSTWRSLTPQPHTPDLSSIPDKSAPTRAVVKTVRPRYAADAPS